MSITPDQMLQARTLLKWSRTRLGARIGVIYDIVRTYETSGRIVPGLNLGKARGVLEAAGVEFIAESDGVPGVRLKKGATSMITSAQWRAARALLGRERNEIAQFIGELPGLVMRLETGSAPVAANVQDKARASFEAAGVEFLPDGGVRLKKSDAGSIPAEYLNASNDE